MGLLSRGFERKSEPLDSFLEVLRAGMQSKSGATINLTSAFKVSVAFSCIRKLSNGCAQVPFKPFQETESNGLKVIRPATDHPLYDLITVAPNAWTTSFEFRETMVMHAALGNAYAFKSRISRTGKLVELIILPPNKVEKVQKPDWSIVYKVTGKNGVVREVPAEDIWHIRGPSWDGVLGMDVLNLAREALGLAISTEESHAKLHAKGIRASGTYTVEGPLSGPQYAQLKKWITEEFAGAENAGVPMILDRGAKWLQQAMTGLDAQHLETRKFQIEEVCRFFDVMPIMVGYSDKASTYASAEQMFLAHVVHTLMPWYARIEQSADANLLTQKEREAGYYFKFIAAGLLRGASKDRGEYFAKALGTGGGPAWMTQDEVRALEELNPFGGEASGLPPRSSGPASPAPQGD